MQVLANQDLGWSALAVAILTEREVGIDEAFERLDRPLKWNQPYRRTKHGRDVLHSEETQIMAEMKQKRKTYKEIADFFGTTKWAVYNRLRRLKAKGMGI